MTIPNTRSWSTLAHLENGLGKIKDSNWPRRFVRINGHTIWLGDIRSWWFESKSGENSPVDMVNIPVIYRGFSTIPGGDRRISEASTVAALKIVDSLRKSSALWSFGTRSFFSRSCGRSGNRWGSNCASANAWKAWLGPRNSCKGLELPLVVSRHKFFWVLVTRVKLVYFLSCLSNSWAGFSGFPKRFLGWLPTQQLFSQVEESLQHICEERQRWHDKCEAWYLTSWWWPRNPERENQLRLVVYLITLGFQPPLKQWVEKYNHHCWTLRVLIIQIGSTIILMVVEA